MICSSRLIFNTTRKCIVRIALHEKYTRLCFPTFHTTFSTNVCILNSQNKSKEDTTSNSKEAKKTPSYFESEWYKDTSNVGISGKTLKKAEKEQKRERDHVDKFMKMWSHSEQMADSMTRVGIQYFRGDEMGPNLTEKDDFSIGFKIPNPQENIFQLPQRYFDALQQLQAEHSDDMIEKVEASDEILDYKLPRTCTFHDLNITSRLVEKLDKKGIVTPTPIQDLAIPLVVKGKTILFQSETGSGKTLVFLLPALQDPGPAYGTLILVPTRELVSQMTHEAHSLLRDKSIVASFVSGVDLTEQEKILNDSLNPPRIVIATPTRLWEIVRKYTELFSKTKRIVVDEVDKVLLPLSRRASKIKMKRRTLRPRPGRLVVEALQEVSKERLQLIAASATVDDLLVEELEEMGWGEHIDVIKPSTLEKKTKNVPECIEHKFVIVDDLNGITKASMLGRLFRKSGHTSALVFIHSTASVDDFMWELKEYGLKAEALYRHLSEPLGFGKFLEDFQSGKIELVIANEETVRGLDFPELKHVYLLEVPKNADHYVHLAGRVGRRGNRGTCTAFVSTSDPRDIRRLLLEYSTLDLECEEIVLD